MLQKYHGVRDNCKSVKIAFWYLVMCANVEEKLWRRR